MINRAIDLSIARAQSCFLWGPRQTGKSTLLKALLPTAPYYDLLLSAEYRR
jgi:predicted AAA+ superfamily ATPase